MLFLALLLSALTPARAQAPLGADASFYSGLGAVREAALGAARAPAAKLPAKDPLSAAARRLVRAVSSGEPLDPLFDDAFIQAVGGDKLQSMGASLRRSGIRELKPLPPDSASEGAFLMGFDNGLVSRVKLVLSAADPEKIAGLMVGDPGPEYKSLSEVAAALSELPGRASFKAVRLGAAPKTLAELNASEPLGIGSVLKLYILAGLVEDGVAWDRVVLLQDGLRSWPSGDMQTWPAGSPVTVHTLAVKMIYQSDNTATDHLLALLGRERVEAMLGVLGNEHAALDRPFLSTAEAFKLLSSKPLGRRWLAADEAGRRALLAGPVRDFPAEKVQVPPQPVSPLRLGWLASADDICRALAWFHERGDATALGILGVNRGLDVPRSAFPYAGFKGGSLPGVLNLSFLLRTPSGEAYALTAGWTDPDAPVDDARFFPLVQRAVDLLALQAGAR